MANRDTPMGLRPAYHFSGGVMRTSRYHIANAYAVAIFRGDLIHKLGTARNIEAGDNPDTTPSHGVFWGCSYRDASGNQVYSKFWPAAQATLGSEGAIAYVYDDPDIVYEIQVTAGFVADDIGQSADYAYTVGSTLTGNSKTELDSATYGGDLALNVVDLIERPDNAFGTNANIYVVINEHGLRNAGAAGHEEV